ncbi:MAG: hypothetical protein ACTSYI_12665 [Promethearchaeota archaeon]
MKNDYLKILSAIKYLNLEIDSPTLNKSNRIFIQKFVYILKNIGFDFSNYGDYNFYLNGMYSPNLTQDYYQIVSDTQEFSLTNFQQKEIDALGLYRESILDNSFFKSNKIEFHEAITTLLYLRQKFPEYSERELVNKAKELKNHLSSKIITVSLNVVKKLQFSIDMITQDIQKEFQLWDSLNGD